MVLVRHVCCTAAMCKCCLCAAGACRTMVERTDRSTLNRDSLVDMVSMVLDNAGIAVSNMLHSSLNLVYTYADSCQRADHTVLQLTYRCCMHKHWPT
jgi:hypothetical protein